MATIEDEMKVSTFHGDPAPTKTDLPREQVMQMVERIGSGALDQLRDMRDVADALMVTIRQHQEELTNQIQEFADAAEATIQTKEIVSQALGQLQSRYRNPKVTVQTMRAVEPPPPGRPTVASNRR